MDEQGVKLAAGTDAGIPGASFGTYVDGLEAFAHAGLTTERIIEIATVQAAAALQLAGTTGQLAPGLSADLLVVDGNPLDDLGALRAVRLVLARGRPYVPFPVRSGHMGPSAQPSTSGNSALADTPCR